MDISNTDDISGESLRERGFAFHEGGNLADAERAYREVLRRSPADGSVKYALGVLAVQTGRFEFAVDNLTAAIAVNGTADAYEYLGNAYFGLSRFEEALASYGRAIDLSPVHAGAHINRGHVLRALGRRPEALASYDLAIASRPQFPEAHISRADLLRDMGRPQEALAAYGNAVAVAPDVASVFAGQGAVLLQLRRWADALASVEKAIILGDDRAETHVMRGLALDGLERPESALTSFDRALALRPDYAAAHINRGNLLRRLKRPEEALECYRKALAECADSFEALAGSATALSDLGRHAEAMLALDRALESRPERAAELDLHRAAALAGLERFSDMLRYCDRSVASRPDDAECRIRRAIALHKLGRRDEALAECDVAVALAPGLGEAHVIRGAVLRDLQRIGASIESFAAAAELRPDDALTRFALGCAYLLDGRLERGWRLYAENGWAGKADKRPAVREYPQLQWRGSEDIAGKTLYLYPDQGLGDTIQFARYALLAQARGANVVLSVQNGLRRLMSSLHPRIRVGGEFEVSAAFDRHSPLAGLPGAFNSSLQTIPAVVPYLRAEEARTSDWRRRLGTHGFKVGVCWQGSGQKTGAGRSFALSELEKLARLTGVRLISLQMFHGIEQLDRLPPGMTVETLGEDFDVGPDAFLDTAAVMESLDLIITCDTSIVHLAGALARPTWLALRHVPDWRWMLDRDDSPWYPTVRLFRQASDGDWKGVFDAMHDALAVALGI